MRSGHAPAHAFCVFATAAADVEQDEILHAFIEYHTCPFQRQPGFFVPRDNREAHAGLFAYNLVQ